MELFNTAAVWLEQVLLPYGGVGLMLLAMCDSSFLSLPEVNDILLVTFSIRTPGRMAAYAGLTTLGSVAGCSMLYAVGRRGGGAFLWKRAGKNLSARKIRQWFERYGMLAVIVPSLLPPPTPFKIFVLSAGAFGVSWPRFLIAVALGRSVRYFSEGILAVLYGERAIALLGTHYPVVALAVSLAALLGVVVFVTWRRR